MYINSRRLFSHKGINLKHFNFVIFLSIFAQMEHISNLINTILYLFNNKFFLQTLLHNFLLLFLEMFKVLRIWFLLLQFFICLQFFNFPQSLILFSQMLKLLLIETYLRCQILNILRIRKKLCC